MNAAAIADGCRRAARRRKHARPEELRDAALALFVEKGFDATRTEEIAARAGVSKGTLYLYYPSKESLLKAVIDAPVFEALAGFSGETGGEGNRADVLRGALSGIRAKLQAGAVGNILKLIIAESRRFPEFMEIWQRKVEKPVHSVIAKIVRQGMDRGEFRNLDADVAADSLLLPMFMSCLHPHLTLPGTAARRPGEAVFVQHVELVLHGLLR